MAAARENLVGVCLMADVPNEAVVRCVEDIVQSDCKFDDAEGGAEMAARGGDGAEGFPAELVRELL